MKSIFFFIIVALLCFEPLLGGGLDYPMIQKGQRYKIMSFKDDAKDTSCYIYRNYSVKVSGQKSQSDTNPVIINVFKIRRTKSFKNQNEIHRFCDNLNGPYMSLKLFDTFTFYEGIKDDFLFIDSGTDVMRNLAIYSLKSKQKVKDLYLENYQVMRNLVLFYELEKNLKKTDEEYKKCFKEINIDYGLVLERLMIYDLNNDEIRKTNEITCAYRQ